MSPLCHRTDCITGHSLGLQHSTDPHSVMYPQFVTTNLDLSQDDIEHAQILYGMYTIVNPFVLELTECANNIDPDQPQPNAASDHNLCCLVLSQDAYYNYHSSRHHRVRS